MGMIKKTELRAKVVSFFIISLMITSIFTVMVGADVTTRDTDAINVALNDLPLNRGNTGYESWLYYISDMVCTANGNLYLSEEDISINARGFDIEIIRSYNSHNNETQGPFGYGWTYNYNIKLVESPDGSVTMFDEDGSVHNFTNVGGGGYTSPPGIHSKLTKNPDDSFVLRFKAGSKYNFDSDGNLQSIVDKNGNSLTFSYTDGKLTRIADDSGLALTLNYNAFDWISSIVDPLGRQIKYNYNLGNLEKVKDAMGNSSLYLYYGDHKLKGVVDRVDSMLLFSYYKANGAGRIEYINKSSYDRTEKTYLNPFSLYSFSYNDYTTYATDAMGHTTEIGMNDFGNPVRITDALDGVTTMGWDGDMNLVSVTDANGHTNRFDYDAYGDLISQTDQTDNTTYYGWDVIDTTTDYIASLVNSTNKRGFSTRYEYDAKGNLIRTIDATGNSSSFVHDAFGNIVSATDFSGYTTLSAYDTHANLLNTTDARGKVTEYIFDTVGRLLTVTDANSHTITNVYDDNDRLVIVMDAHGNETTYEYNAVGSLISTTDANGHKTDTSNNIIGKVNEITDPAGNTTSFKYDKNGNLIKYTTAMGSNTTTEYDALGRVVSVIDAPGNAENYTYDAAGNLITERDRNGGITSYTYDALNRLIKITDQSGNTTTYTYDSVGNVISNTDPNGETTSYEYDALDRVNRITDASGNDSLFSYDANGNFLRYTDANGHATRYEYDELNRRTKAISPLGFQTQYTYDPVGNVISKKDANGYTTLYDYDALDRLALTTYPNGGKVGKDYDAVGNLIQISNIGIGLNDVTQFSYDELDRLTEVTRDYGSFSKTISYTYDKNGNIATMIDSDDGITTHQYDEIDRLVEISDPYGEVTTYQYDNGSRRIGMQRPNGVTTLYSYDAANRLIRLVNKKSGGNVISSYTYTYDNVGNRLSMTEADGNNTLYDYDALYRLINVMYPSGNFTKYTYDAVGNRLSEINSTYSVNYTYDVENRLLTANGVSYAYDNTGNLVSKSDGTNYEYDYENRLIKVTLSDASQVTYLYSANGDRLSRTNSSGTTYYLYDLEDILMELDAGGVQQARYTHGPGIDEPISMHRDEDTFYYQFDGLGSVTSLTDISENVAASYNYDAFGSILEEVGSVVNQYKFTCREYDENTGLYYYRARYYDADVGRFLSKDPVWNPFDTQNSNRYVYVGNNPINRVDPSGQYIIVGTSTIFTSTPWWHHVVRHSHLHLHHEIILKPFRKMFPGLFTSESQIHPLLEPVELKSDDLSSNGGTDVTSIEEWLHFSIAVIPEKFEYKCGETVRVTIFVLNNEEQETIWLGVSFKDPTGEYAKYDPEILITPESATIGQNEIKVFEAEWTIPTDAPEGIYEIAVNCWKDNTFTEKYSDNLEWERIFYMTGPKAMGLQYLRTTQRADGSWSNNVGITSLAVLAFLNAGCTEDDPTVNKAIQYILGKRNAGGSFERGIYNETFSDCNLTIRRADGSFGGGTYDTSLAVLALVAIHNSDYDDEISDAATWLKDSQWDKDCMWGSVDKDNWHYGGFGYGSHTRPDLSNTQFALMALDAVPGISKNDLLWDKAQVFLARVQNRQENVYIPDLDYTVEWNPTYNKYDDGGFVYHPGYSLAGNMKSYGSMTGAGIWGLRLSDVGNDDPRVEAALDWVTDNYMWDGNPGMGNPGSAQYYYYLSMSKALTMIESDYVDGHNWYQDLSGTLAALQKTEGYWINERDSWLWEDNKDLVTSYAILSLQTRAEIPEEIKKLSYLTFILCSNADLHVYDPLGRHVGKNYDTGGIDLEIPGATYNSNDIQEITISELESGDYRILLMGTGEGDYTLNVTGGVGDETVSEDSYTRTISEGEVHDSTVSVAMITWLTIHVEEPEPVLITDLTNVRLITLDPTVTGINVTSLNLSVINETYKPGECITPLSAYMINSTGAGNFTLLFTDIPDANTIIVYKINATNQWIDLNATTTANTVTFTMSVDDPPVVFCSGVLPPIADANGPYTGVIEYIAVPITFDGTGSYDPDGTIVSYDWDLDNDSEFDDAVGAMPTVSFTTPYSGNISLKVTDNNGATDTDTTTLTITKHSPPPNGIPGLIKPPEQPQYFKEKSSAQGIGYVAIDKKIQDWDAAIDVEEHMKGFGEFAMESREILNEAANISDPTDPNYIHQKMINFQGNATNRLFSTERFESPAFYGGTGTRVNKFFDVSELQKDESSSIKTISAPGGGQSHSFETMDEFSGIWSTDSEWQEICQKDIRHHQLFKGNFSVQKDLTFEREVGMP